MLVAAHVVPGIDYDTKMGLLTATLVLGLLNAFVRPVMMLFSLPLLVLTFGLFTLVINATLLYLVGHMKTFHVKTFGAALLGAIIVSIVSIVLNTLTGSGESRVQVKRGKPAPPKSNDDGGPVIDV